MEALILAARERNASDVHLVFGLPPMLRIDGELMPLEGAAPLDDAACARYAAALAEGRPLPERGELDLARSLAGLRLRVNLFRQQGHVSAAIRLLRGEIPRLETLGLPPAVPELARLRRGVVLVTGETGSGKSTTLAALLDEINRSRRAHILTLEDPVEYIHTPRLCLVNQREVGRDAASFGEGLRAALREDPDVLLIGELRDPDTIETALTAAETGHLVFGTLHTGSAADSVDRIVSAFPAERQQQLRMQLSMTLRAVLTQQLLPRAGGPGRVLACELMPVTPAVRNLIREGKTPQLANAVATSAKEGGQSMDNALVRLCRERRISAETALRAAQDPEYVKRACAL